MLLDAVHHHLEVRRELAKQPILFGPGDRIGLTPGFGQHRDHWRHCIEPRAAVLVAVGSRSPMQDRAHNLQAAIDRGCSDAFGTSCGDERRQGCIVNLIRIESPDLADEELDVDADGLQATQVLALCEVAQCAIGKVGPILDAYGMLDIDACHFGFQPLLGNLLAGPPKPYADAHTVMPLVDESPTLGTDGDSRGARGGHDGSPAVRRCFIFKLRENWVMLVAVRGIPWGGFWSRI